MESQYARNFTIAAVIMCLTVSVSAATPLSYRIDSGASYATAKVAFLGVSSKTANFPSITGEARFRPDNLSSASVNVSIDARKLTAGDGTTQTYLKGKDFFWVEQYPTVTFKSSSLSMASTTTGTLSGNLTARGVTKPVSMRVTFSKPPANATTGGTLTLTGTTTINRRAFGMKAYSSFVGKKVNIVITASLVGS